MDASTPILLSGAVVIADGTRRSGGWPESGAKSVAATLALAVAFSMASNIPKSASVVKALAWLLFIGVLFNTPIFRKAS